MKAIGIVFDIDKLGGGFYGDTAWRIFMRNLRPERIMPCGLREGDTNESLRGNRREFCIAVFGVGVDTHVVEEAFQNCSDTGLAEPSRRFIRSPRLDSEPLRLAGMVDSQGRLVDDEWSRISHDRCKDCGWGFAPKKVTVYLSPELTSELKELRSRTVSPFQGSNQIANPTSQTMSKRPWWQFWK